MTRRLMAVLLTLTALLVGLIGPVAARPPSPGPVFPITDYAPRDSDNVVLKWNETMLATIRATSAGAHPPANSRALAILSTAMYDAWAAYDATAKATQGNARVTGPQSGSPEDRADAISYAAYTVLTRLGPYKDTEVGGTKPADATLAALGLTAGSTETPAQVGVGAAEAVLSARQGDGSSGSVSYTPRGGYDNETEAFLWQPLDSRPALVPHWGRVTGFGLPGEWRSDDRYMAEGPKTNNGNVYKQAAREIVGYGNSLTDEQKACAVYWADGPTSETPPGHWNAIAQAVSRRDGHTVDEDVRMFFALGNALLNAGVVSWEAKYRYDFARPATVIRWMYYYAEKPNKRDPAMQHWTSYIATPPFPEYTSGHSTFSGAAAQILRNATGSDHMGMSVVVPKGAGVNHLSPGKTAPGRDVTLSWSTFTEAVGGEQGSGRSRLYGGIHFADANEHGLATGANAGQAAWSEAQRYISGAAGH